MKNSSIKIRVFIFLNLMLFLITPVIQNQFNLKDIAPLKGAITLPLKEKFSVAAWLEGSYQVKQEEYLNQVFGFRSLFIRINNQIAFNLFKKAKANGVIVGKNNYLFEENYIKAYYGTDFIGEDSIMHRMQRLKFISDTLTKLNKTVIVVFAAGKGSFYPEYIPRKYERESGRTNYKYHVKLADEYGLKNIDFNKYFIENKNISRYPLYPQYGIHWSYYGMCLAADSMIRYIEKERNIDMPNLYWDDVELSDPKETDYDIADGMNLKFRLKTFKMAYPQVKMQSESGKSKPSVIVISDSFYWGMFNLGISKAFSKSQFWFYNKQIYPDSYRSPIETDQVNLKEEIDRHDVFIIMASEAMLPGLGWGFIENMYNDFRGIKSPSEMNSEFQKKVKKIRDDIKTDKSWMEHIAKKAAKNNISVDSMLTLDAIWQIQHEGK